MALSGSHLQWYLSSFGLRSRSLAVATPECLFQYVFLQQSSATNVQHVGGQWLRATLWCLL